MPHFLDAHLHLQDTRLRPGLDAIASELRRLGITRWVVNGTREADWPEVARLAESFPEVLPCYGLHPWFIEERGERWEQTLADFLSSPGSRAAAIGEIGLDKWIRPHHIDGQERVFRRQLQIASDRGLPVVIHCLKAWGRLRDVLRSELSSTSAGFLLHSFAGPEELIDEFAALGAYFSFSGHFLRESKAAILDTYRCRVPRDRLLIETDAPDMRLPAALETHALSDADGEPVNHPANLVAVYQGLARALDLPLETLADQVAENFARLFDRPPSHEGGCARDDSQP